MHKKITDIIFDLDGTLIDSAPSILDSFKQTLDSNKIKSLLPLNPSLIGPPLVQTLIALTGITDLEILDKLSEEFKGHYDIGGYRSTQTFFGIPQLLDECSNKGFHMHIATNKRLSPTLLILRLFSWQSYFKSVYTTDSCIPSYEDKSAMLSDLLKKEGVNIGSAIYVGDRMEDKLSARNNDLDFMGALWGYRDPKLASQIDCLLFQNVAQFKSHLRV